MPVTDLSEIQIRALRDSKAWFPTLHATPSGAMAHHLCGLIGEVGELAAAIELDGRLDAGHPLHPIIEDIQILGARGVTK